MKVRLDYENDKLVVELEGKTDAAPEKVRTIPLAGGQGSITLDENGFVRLFEAKGMKAFLDELAGSTDSAKRGERRKT